VTPGTLASNSGPVSWRSTDTQQNTNLQNSSGGEVRATSFTELAPGIDEPPIF